MMVNEVQINNIVKKTILSINEDNLKKVLTSVFSELDMQRGVHIRNMRK